MSFDLTFDATFGGNSLIPVLPGVPAYDCRKEGVYLSWQAWGGRCYWLFEAERDTTKEVIGLGSVKQGGAIRTTARESIQKVVVRTQGVTAEVSELLSTIPDANRVWVWGRAVVEEVEVFQPFPVFVAPGSYSVHRTADRRYDVSFLLEYPSRINFRS